MYRWEYLTMLIKKNGYKNILEIGTAAAQNASYILNNIDDRDFNLITVDPYLKYDDFSFDVKNNIKTLNGLEIKAKKALINHINNGRCTMIKKLSDSYANEILDQSFDLVFIDGNHSYEYVKNDIKNLYPKVKKGGLLTGHDYNEQWPGVMKAVNEYVEYYNLKLDITGHDSIWVIKV